MNYEATENTGYCIPAEVRFYGISDVARMTGWSEKTVQKLFASGELLLLQKNIRKSWHAVTQPFRKYYINVLIRI